jgi:hypothetical protein
MLFAVRWGFGIAFLAQLAVVVWACTQQALWDIPGPVTGNVWFQATLTDTYIAFFTVYGWMAYRMGPCWGWRLLWLVAVICLGTVATSAFVVGLTFRLPANATVKDLLLRADA